MKSEFERTGRLQGKIDIFTRERGQLVYRCSTQWWRTCRDAAQNWADIHSNGETRDAKGRRRVVARRA